MAANSIEESAKDIFKQLLQAPVIVSALGYFVDIYDLLLFSIVRVPSLRALGLNGDELLRVGILLINVQMGGLLVGGILWGIIGDKKGRLSVLFGSILLYSMANIANGFAATVEQYAIFRFVAGIGLAGELGAGITLVAEILPKQIRGYGTALVASVGILGAVLAYFVAKVTNWQVAYWIGGGLGFALLLLRYSVAESSMFKKVTEAPIVRGNFLTFFTSLKKFTKYMRCILIGLPIWFVMGILITFSPEFGHQLAVSEVVDAGMAVMLSYLGLFLGDITSGGLSQLVKSRKKIVLLFLALIAFSIIFYLTSSGSSISMFYFSCFVLGFSIGYWALFVTIAAEQFGTNLRATAATTIPNFVRGTVLPITFCFNYLREKTDMITGAWIVGFAAIFIALLALWKMKETFGKELDYVEEL